MNSKQNQIKDGIIMAIVTTEDFRQAFVERLQSTFGKSLEASTNHDRYITLSSMIRDIVLRNWVESRKSNSSRSSRQVYYFSMEFLPGRFLISNMIHLGIKDLAEGALNELGLSLDAIAEEEPDPAIGTGGLGRLGACFLDSMASMGIPGHGCSIMYRYGLFKQRIVDGYQVEIPDNWLVSSNVWEVRKPERAVYVKFGGSVRADFVYGRMVFLHEGSETVRAVPHDVPIVGYGNKVVNTLRLWESEAPTKDFDFSLFSRGEYATAMKSKHEAEAISDMLYPDDSSPEGKKLRLKQQYFLVSAGLQSILRHHREFYGPLTELPDKAAIQINDTHPALCIPELMRILMDEEGLGWEQAWDITTRTVNYTNHTIMPEALERWSEHLFRNLLPRIYMIVEEMQRRLRLKLEELYPGQLEKQQRMFILKDGHVHMANMAIFGSTMVNGVAKVHSAILKEHLFRDFAEVYPNKFINMTNGISPRRFLVKANPGLTGLITSAIGDGWMKDPLMLKNLEAFSEDASFLEQLAGVKRANKSRLSDYIASATGIATDPDSIFHVHIKRIHAYKRQLMNALSILDTYNMIKDGRLKDMHPRTYIFSGKAAPTYYLAKDTIKLLSSIADRINSDSDVNGLMKVIFLENYGVSLAERIIPAADVSHQISTASKEASGTGNMKLMMNGAVTLGTMDGANIEIFEEVGSDNMFVFGLDPAEVMTLYSSNSYRSYDLYCSYEPIGRIIDQLSDGTLPAGRHEFDRIRTHLLEENDEFLTLKDFPSFSEALASVEPAYRDKARWSRMSLMNIARSGRFSSDLTIGNYARQIWKIEPSD